MLAAARPGGLVLDLQVMPPDPRIESGGEVVCEIDGRPLLDWADAARAAVDARVAAGDLVEEAVDDHDVLEHYADGAELVHEWATKERRLSQSCAELVRMIEQPCVVRERCCLTRLRVG